MGSARQALRQARQRRAAARRQGGRSHRGELDAPRVNTPDWLWTRWVARYGRGRARMQSPRRNLIEPPLDLTVKSDPRALGRARCPAACFPTGSVRLLPKGRIEELPGL